MDDAAKVALPGTWTTEDGREASAWLRPITGADQAAIIDRIGRDPAPVIATDLIGACVLLEGGEPLGTQAARGLVCRRAGNGAVADARHALGGSDRCRGDLSGLR